MTNKKSEKYRDLLLVIPAYNEAENIERVVDELISDFPQFPYVVITDGPTDGTDEICKRRGYNMVELEKNMGLTKCFKCGMQYAKENDYSYVVQFDGDGQHRPEYIEEMYKKAKEGYDIVLGSRFLDGSGRMGSMRKLGSSMIRKAIKKKTGARISDPTCGMRLYNRRIIDAFADEKSAYSPEPDTIAYLIKNGAKVAEVPVTIDDREAGASYLNAGKAAEYMKRILGSIHKM